MDRLEKILSDFPHLNLKDQIVNKDIYASRFGASSDVYSAWSLRHKRKVAVKRIRTFMTNDEALVKVS